MNKISIINNFKLQDYFSHPFPFFLINNAYDEKTYDYLEKDYKLFHNYFQKNLRYKENNIRLQITTQEFFNSKLFTNSIWKDFIEFHTSKVFFMQLVEIFRKDMEKIYPKIVNIIDKENNQENFLGIRNEKNKKKFKFVADCQPGINTPTIYKSSVRESHLDNSAELFAGLFYLRDNLDNSSGGDLEVMKIKKNKKAIFYKKSLVQNQSDLHVYKKIKYEKNKVIFFLNTKDSIHRISPRSETNIPRNLTNIIFETYNLDAKLFSPYHPQSRFFSMIKSFIGTK